MAKFDFIAIVIGISLACLWNGASAMPYQQYQPLISDWMTDENLNRVPDHRNDAMCVGKSDGFYAYDGQCGPDYYACVAEVFYSQTCPGGNTFDPNLLTCVSPSSASCLTTTTTTTTVRPTVKPFSCPADGFYPIAACSSSFYACIGGQIYPQSCPPNGVFEPSLSVCVSSDTAPCKATTTLSSTTTTGGPTTGAPTSEAPTTEAPTSGAPTTEAPTTEAPTTEAPTTEAPTTEAPTTEASTTLTPFICPSDGFFEMAPCSSSYYLCIGGQEYVQQCPANGIFVGPPTTACKLPEQTSCSPTDSTVAPTDSTVAPTESTVPPTDSTAAPTDSSPAPTSSTTQATTFDCLSEGFFPVDPNVCAPDYYTCYAGDAYLQTCPTPNVFDPAIGSCTSPSNASCNNPDGKHVEIFPGGAKNLV